MLLILYIFYLSLILSILNVIFYRLQFLELMFILLIQERNLFKPLFLFWDFVHFSRKWFLNKTNNSEYFLNFKFNILYFYKNYLIFTI